MGVKGSTGYATLFMPGERVRERDTFTCNHCNSMRFITPASDKPYDGVGDLCYGCDKPVCEGCARRLGQGFKCEVFEVKLARYEAKQAFLSALNAG